MTLALPAVTAPAAVMIIRDMRAAHGHPRTRKRHRWLGAARTGPGLVRAGLGTDCQNRVIKAGGVQ